MIVKKINRNNTKDFILHKHYLGRMPNIKYAFGLFIDEILVGVLTIGKPASNSLCEGICGKEFKQYVYELNRLVVIDNLPRNTLSQFVSKVLKLLKKENMILVSYADSGMGHHGYIYQATNWIYTGFTNERTDKYSIDGKHSRHYNNEYDFLRVYRTSKFRYVYFIGKMKKIFLKNLKYKIISKYPKGNNKRYILGTIMKRKIINTKTNKVFFE